MAHLSSWHLHELAAAAAAAVAAAETAPAAGVDTSFFVMLALAVPWAAAGMTGTARD